MGDPGGLPVGDITHLIINIIYPHHSLRRKTLGTPALHFTFSPLKRSEIEWLS